jgi:acetyl/propionyl-CoA carboxylase alpha subunit
VLVANRGEIAVRVLNEARDSGRTAIAVYSEADADALHVREADLAVCIGPALASESYLNIEAVLDAARKTGAEAIHPGYGFLSENAAFARAVIEAGLVWIGPPPEAIDAMGDKARAKELMIKAGVPTLPGWQGADQSDANLKAEADKIGYPLLIKAVAGGGGRGMRIVRQASEFDEALASARREAKSAFGDDAVLIEKFVERGRHVEIQVFADQAWEHHPSRRTRLLGSASPPESDRGSAVSGGRS